MPTAPSQARPPFPTPDQESALAWPRFVQVHQDDQAALVREFAPRREMSEQGELLRGLPVRLALQRPGAVCELQLDERALFFPSDAALASWMAQAHEQNATVVFD